MRNVKDFCQFLRIKVLSTLEQKGGESTLTLTLSLEWCHKAIVCSKFDSISPGMALTWRLLVVLELVVLPDVVGVTSPDCPRTGLARS